MQAALPTMRERGAGRILNISSPAGRFTPPLEGVYSASKAALEMLSEAIRFEAGHFGVQVTIVQALWRGGAAAHSARRDRRDKPALCRGMELRACGADLGRRRTR